MCGTCNLRKVKCVDAPCQTVCPVCHTVGHGKGACSRKGAAPAQRRAAPTCGYCGGVGHTKRTCAQLREELGADAMARACSVCGQVGHNIGTCPQREQPLEGRRAGAPPKAAIEREAKKKLTRHLNPWLDGSGNRTQPGQTGRPGFQSNTAEHESRPGLIGFQFQAADTQRIAWEGSRGVCSIRTHSSFDRMPVERRVKSAPRVYERAARIAERHERETPSTSDVLQAEYRRRHPEERILPAPRPSKSAKRGPGIMRRTSTTPRARTVTQKASVPQGCSVDLDTLTTGFDAPDTRDETKRHESDHYKVVKLSAACRALTCAAMLRLYPSLYTIQILVHLLTQNCRV
eukprot:SAG11_NODE_21_length_25065_cov_3.589081_12_plen_346_part_00